MSACRLSFVPHLDFLHCNIKQIKQALALASGLVMYINMVLTLVLVIVLALVPRTRRDNVKLSLWDYVTILTQQG